MDPVRIEMARYGPDRRGNLCVATNVRDTSMGWEVWKMLNKDSVDKELARRMCAAFVSYQLGVTVATQYKNMPKDVGDLWYFLASLAQALARESQHIQYGDWGRLATTIIQ